MSTPPTFGPAPGYQLPTPTGDIDKIQRAYRERLADVERRSAELKAGMAANVVEVASADGAVRVTVTATGSLSNVVFGPRSESLSPVRLGETFMKAYREACRQATERTLGLVEEFAGENSPAAARIREILPDDEEAEA